MLKASLAALAALLVLVAGEAPASSFARQDVSIPMDDGVSIAATLYVPEGTMPAGGWPAIVVLHGLSGNRQQMNALAEGYGFVGSDYAVLTFDARGHGAVRRPRRDRRPAGGRGHPRGPRLARDASRTSRTRGSAPGASRTAAGQIFNSLVAGVPWAAVVTVETWTDLYSALMPQGLAKSGLVAGLAGSIPEAKRDPSLTAVQAAAFAGNTAAVRPWATERSSISRLGSVTTPVFMAQGRRDFLFGIDQGSLAFQRLRGPKVLYVGLHGHAPSTFPAADTTFLMGQMRSWFDTFLRDVPGSRGPAAVAVASERFGGQVPWTTSLPKTTPTTVAFPGVSTFARSGKAVRTSAPLRKAIEVFGSPTVRVPVAASGGWSRLVAVLTARTPQGTEIVVSAGGAPTRSGSRAVTIRMIDQATFVPRGSRLKLTLASSSTAQASSNVLYLDLPMPTSARARLGAAVLRLPGLRTPVTK